MKAKFDPVLSHFLREAQRYPVLTPESEIALANAWRTQQDRKALEQLVGSHLRLVFKIARGYAGYGFALGDLVAEGNIGLLRAADRFDAARGFRFATYAVWWIRAEIQEFVLRSWSLVRIASTAVQKKLFFNLRRLRARLQEYERGDLTPESLATVVRELRVSEGAVVDMDRRLRGNDDSLNARLTPDSDAEWLELLPDDRANQEEIVAENEEFQVRRDKLTSALGRLSPREQDVITQRYLESEQATLDELAHKYSVSSERIRQIEMHAIDKLRHLVAGTRGRNLGSLVDLMSATRNNAAALELAA